MHIPRFDNQNKAIVDQNDSITPLVYFNIVQLSEGETYTYQIADYETCVVPATGSVKVSVGQEFTDTVGLRAQNVWDGEPEGVYVPVDSKCQITCITASAEVFVSGAQFDNKLAPFSVHADEILSVQYGSDDTKTHRKIKHILGQNHHDRVGRLLVSELFTVGQGGWSGFPSHKHASDRPGLETKHDEVYNFRFNPSHGSALQLLQKSENDPGEAFHVMDGSTFQIDDGYHPCVVMPGYEMYYFTVLGAATHRGLSPHFQDLHKDQLETIPGMKAMWDKFK